MQYHTDLGAPAMHRTVDHPGGWVERVRPRHHVPVFRVEEHEVGRGTGATVMGHPFEALTWLANSRSARGQGLRRGEFVFLGSLVETKWLNAGDRVAIEVEGLGTASLSVTA